MFIVLCLTFYVYRFMLIVLCLWFYVYHSTFKYYRGTAQVKIKISRHSDTGHMITS